MNVLQLLRKITPRPILVWLEDIRINKTAKEWEKNGKPLPPPHEVKQLAIRKYQRKFLVSKLVETGTYLGEMVDAQKNVFKNIISIELGEQLYKDAVEKFKNYERITILHGDSGKVLQEVVPQLKKKVLFWLDGHYSAGITVKGEKECPIYEEIDAIFKNDLNHILLIDDARCFIGVNDYPTIDELERYIKSKNPKYSIEVEDDIIRATPNDIH